MRWELLRAMPAGAVETVSTTFAVLLADRVFGVGDWGKATLVAVAPLGLLLSLFLVQFVRRSALAVNKVLAAAFTVSGAGYALAATAGDSFAVYLSGMIPGVLGFTVSVPLFAQIYRHHFPDKTRGTLFSITAFVRKLAAVGFGLLFGLMLAVSLSNAPWVLLSYAAASFVMATMVFRIDDVTLSPARVVKIFDAFRHVKENAEFRRLLISWMILGLGNLLCFSLFVEYITNERYGWALPEDEVSLITTVIPELCFVVTVLIWGRIFDRFPIYRLRALINLFFIAAIAVYYLPGEKWGLYVGIGLHGVARAGGNVIWSLWVTRFARAEHVAEYMSVHTFLTGCRGVLAPFIAFRTASTLGPNVVAWTGIVMVAVATLMLGRRIWAPNPAIS